MVEAELVIFDDAVARDWYPFTLTRPAGELLLGTLTLRARAERALGLRCVGYICAEHLNGFEEVGAPRVLGDGATQRFSDKATVYLCSRAVLHWDLDPLDFSQPATLRLGGSVAGWIVPAGEERPSEDDLVALSPNRPNAKSLDLGGAQIANVWDLIAHNHDHIASDILHMFPNAAGGSVSGPIAGGAVPGAHFIGEYPLIVGDDVSIEPGVVFDLSAGPIWLEKGVAVRALTRIAGPMYVGKDSQLLGGLYTASSIGPLCKVHGEVEESIILGYSNKAHEGFLGHAIVGKWCNFGALTTNSDLKNNYSNVRVHTPGGEVDSGLMKLGSLIGDHVKTAIGTMLNTGTVIGPGANVFGGMPPKHVKPFAWGDGKYELEKFLETAERVMQRRKMELSPSQRDMLSRVWRE